MHLSRLTVPVRMIMSAIALVAPCAAGADELFLDFESPADVARVSPARADVAISDAHATSGRRSLKVTFHAGDYPIVNFLAGKAFPSPDWRPYQSLEFDFYLDVPNKPGPAGEMAMPLFMEFASGSGATARRRTFVSTFASRKTGHMSITTLGLRIGGEGLLASGAGFGRIAAWDTNVDIADVQGFGILADHLTAPVVLYLDNFRLTPRLDKPLVDEFGQYNLREWPGKVHSEDELRQAGQRDLSALARPLPGRDRDQYGGWRGGRDPTGRPLRFEPRGRFYTAQQAGRWWFVTPDGNAFWSVGCDGITMEATSPKWDDDHKALYAWIPSHEGRFAGAWEHSWTGGPILAKANLIRRYEGAYAGLWRRVAARRMLDWGFNSLGAWCDLEVAHQEGLRLPYVFIMGNQNSPPQMAEGLPDVYDPAWENGVRQAVQAAAKYRDDPWCVGHFYDNELGWCGGWHKEVTVAQQVLAKGPESAAKQALVAMLRKRHDGEVEALNAAWRTSFTGFEEILGRPVKLSPESEKAAAADFSAFVEEAADRYYSTVARELKAVDPRHLYLGSRLAQAPIEAVRAAGRHCDVLSFNIYAVEVDRSECDALYAATRKPFLVGEFNFGARDRGVLGGAGVVVATQADRGAGYRRYVERLAAVPYFVGCHWFEWTDQPFAGRFDGWESGNCGIVDVCFNPYPELTKAMTQTNRGIYRMASKP